MQDVGTGDFTLHTRTDDGSGICISSPYQFNFVDIQVSTAGDQTTPVMIVEYYSTASAWVNLNSDTNMYAVLNWNTTGEREVCWAVPPDQGTGGEASMTAANYNVIIRMTNGGAGTVNPLGSQVTVGRMYGMTDSVTDNTTLTWTPANYKDGQLEPNIADGIFGYCSTATAVRNQLVEVAVRSGR